jgi:hypothetical protein
MNKLNGKPAKNALARKARHASAPLALRLQVAMKRGKRWPIPLAQLAAGTSKIAARILRLDTQRVELSVIRSVAQASLRRGANVWGR